MGHMMFVNYDNLIEDYAFKRASIGKKLKFLIWPKRCYISGKLLFLQYAYKQTAMWTGPGDPVFEHRYYDKNEFLIAQIKGEV
jgi:hypothetical protein